MVKSKLSLFQDIVHISCRLVSAPLYILSIQTFLRKSELL